MLADRAIERFGKKHKADAAASEQGVLEQLKAKIQQ
jgi:hypothetical protein